MIATLADLLIEGANRFAGRQAAADARESVDYASLAADTSRLARALGRLGLEPGDRSAILLPNGVNFLRAHFANLQAGMVSVPCDAAATAETFRAVAASCAPRVLLTDSAGWSRIADAGSVPECLGQVILLDSDDVTHPQVQVHGAGALMADEPGDLFLRRRAPDDLAVLMYTTGTTGRAKGVKLAHANVIAVLNSISRFVGYSADDREVIILPLSHSFGIGHVYCNLMKGGAVWLENGLARVGRVLKALEEFRATGFPGTPTGFALLMDQYGPVLAQKGRNLRFSVINSAPMPPERTVQLQALLPNLDIMAYYGLTEASRTAFISLSKQGPAYFRSVGQPMGHVEVQLRGPDGGGNAGPGTGEILLRGPALAQGYWDNPEESALAFRDGWFETGDLGRVDEKGFLWISGRLKDLVNVGGYKVNPAEVERVLADLDGVIEVGVAGIPDTGGLAGEAVVAVLSVKPNFSLGAAELERYCLEKLEKYKVPSRYFLTPELPRTNTGKIQRIELSRRIQEGLVAVLA